jgi:antitoxin MazE
LPGFEEGEDTIELTTFKRIGRILYSKEKKQGEKRMQLTRISPKHQITIPKEAFEKLRLEVGDFLEVETTEEGLLLIPKKLVSKDQAWFWSKEWQEKEKEADEAISKGELSKPFKKANELIGHLRKRR